MAIRHLKIVAVGDGMVGKTSLMMAYALNQFPGEYVPTVFDNYAANDVVLGVPCSISLWDTAGQDEYDRIRPLSYPLSDAFLICFSVMSPDSYENIKAKWAPEVRHHCPDVPIILVGTKTDLRGNKDIEASLAKREKQPVTYTKGLQLMKEIGAKTYVEVSAMKMAQVREVFQTAAKAILNKSGKDDVRRKRCSIM